MSYGFIESVHESVRERSRETFKYTAEPQTALFHAHTCAYTSRARQMSEHLIGLVPLGRVVEAHGEPLAREA